MTKNVDFTHIRGHFCEKSAKKTPKMSKFAIFTHIREVFEMGKIKGLLFPKGQTKKKEKNHAKKSIIHNDKYCYLCWKRYGRWNERNLHKHHCFHGSANRRLAEEDGLFINVCVNCHELDREAIHNDHKTDLFVMQQAQKAYEEKIGNREQFVARYGKNFL